MAPREALPVVPLNYGLSAPPLRYHEAVLRALGVVALTAAGFSLGGEGIGFLIGWLVPDSSDQ